MKQEKLYIPLVTGTQKVTMICANNIPLLKESLPTDKQINQNILAQFSVVKQSGHLQPVEVSLKPEKYLQIVKEIKSKTKCYNTFNKIPLYYHISKFPVVVIVSK